MRSVKVASLWESVVNAMHFSPFFHSHPVFLTSFRYRIFSHARRNFAYHKQAFDIMLDTEKSTMKRLRMC